VSIPRRRPNSISDSESPITALVVTEISGKSATACSKSPGDGFRHDLLHLGHITVLEQSRRFGDRLTVAKNSDASVSRQKGPSRPIVGENERARVVAALAAVDAVVVFDESTPLEVILAVRPDVIADFGILVWPTFGS
jgi:cytidyltransferase-like protein